MWWTRPCKPQANEVESRIRSIQGCMTATLMQWILESKGYSRCCLLPSSLRGSAKEDACRLSRQRLRLPQPSSGVKEGLHLRCHHAKASGEAKQNTIRVCQSLRVNDGNVRLGRSVHLGKNIGREGFWNLKVRGMIENRYISSIAYRFHAQWLRAYAQKRIQRRHVGHTQHTVKLAEQLHNLN